MSELQTPVSRHFWEDQYICDGDSDAGGAKIIYTYTPHVPVLTLYRRFLWNHHRRD